MVTWSQSLTQFMDLVKCGNWSHFSLLSLDLCSIIVPIFLKLSQKRNKQNNYVPLLLICCCYPLQNPTVLLISVVPMSSSLTSMIFFFVLFCVSILITDFVKDNSPHNGVAVCYLLDK